MASKLQERIIERWLIGETLSSDDYGWIKKGTDIKTGKIVALRFIEKADVPWTKEKAKQVIIDKPLTMHSVSDDIDSVCPLYLRLGGD